MSEIYDSDSSLSSYSEHEIERSTLVSDDEFYPPGRPERMRDARDCDVPGTHIREAVASASHIAPSPSVSTPKETLRETTAPARQPVSPTLGPDPTVVQEPRINSGSFETTLQQMQVVQGLQQTVSELQTKLHNASGSQPGPQNPSASQQVAQDTENLSLSQEQPVFTHSTHLFDPSGLLEKKFFTGASDLICEYLSKYFSQSLDSQLTAEMAKRFKRPDIPVMRVQRLDQFFLKKEHSYMRGRDQTLQEIHNNLLHAVGPIAELLSMLTEGQVPEPSKIIEQGRSQDF